MKLDKDKQTIHAGLDVDGEAKLFILIDGKAKLITHQMWLEITDMLNLEAGEMPIVTLEKEKFDIT